MYLPSKITKILSNMNRSYIIYYSKGKITSVVVDNKNITISASTKGYLIDIKGSKVILNDLKSIKPLLMKFSTSQVDKSTSFKISENLVELFAENEKTFAVEYLNGNVISIIMDKPSVKIEKTATGYFLEINYKEIAVDSLTDVKRFLSKMNIINENQKESNKNQEEDLYKQLKLDI
mgnify:CR=1 FL=1